MKTVSKLLISVSLIAALAACGDSAPQAVVDQNMVVTRLNAQKNANSYLPVLYPEGTVHPQLGKPIRILMQSDSSVTAQCRYGDGWASGEIQFETGRSLKVKCQTNGTGKGINGCMLESEFQTKTYKDEDGKCQPLTSLEKM